MTCPKGGDQKDSLKPLSFLTRDHPQPIVEPSRESFWPPDHFRRVPLAEHEANAEAARVKLAEAKAKR